MPQSDREAPLDVFVMDGMLVMTVGVDVLAAAVRSDPLDRDSEGPRLSVHDAEAFAQGLAEQFRAEIAENGDTLLAELFDLACGKVVAKVDPSWSWRGDEA